MFYLRNRKHVPYFYLVIETRAEVWENEKCCGNTSRNQVSKPYLRRVMVYIIKSGKHDVERKKVVDAQPL